MTELNASATTGAPRRRCVQVVIDNASGQVPTVRFDEERVVDLADGGVLRAPLGTLTLVFDPSMEIVLRDPVTGLETGQVATHTDVHVLIYSLYMQTVLARDAAP